MKARTFVRFLVPFLLVGCKSQEPSELKETYTRVYPEASLAEERSVALDLASSPRVRPDSGEKGVVAVSPLSMAHQNELQMRGIQAFKDGNLGRASAYFEEAERSIGLGEKELLAASATAYERGDYPKAFERAHALWNLLERRRTKTLEEDLRTSPFREAALVLGVVQLKTHEDKAGVALLESLVQSARDWPAPYLALAEHYQGKKAYNLSARVSNAGLDRAGVDPRLFVALARAYRALGQIENAKITLGRALKIFPEATSVLLWLGISEFENGAVTSACERFALGFAKDESNPVAAHNYSLCLVRGGDWERAENLLRNAIGRNAEVSHLRLLYGVVLKRLGNLRGARQTWGEFLALSESSDEKRALVEAALQDLTNEEGAPEKGLLAPMVP
jgi:tetratricopeptide (TPR) repeat protein